MNNKKYQFDINQYHRYCKLGGCLVLFIVSVLLSLLFFFPTVMDDVHAISLINKELYYDIYIGCVAVAVVDIISILWTFSILLSFSKNKSAYRYIKIALIGKAVLSIVACAITIITFKPEDTFQFISSTVANISYSGVWLAYFCSSVRVKYYFRLITPN